MSFSVQLLNTTDDPRKLDKTFTTIATVTATPTENCTILSPRLILNYTGTLTGVNYMYIPFLERYYFVNDITLSTAARIMISGSIDVLKTYSSQIKSCDGTVIRSESIGHPTEIPDSMLPIDPNRYEYKSILFSKGFSLDPNDSNFLLMTR